MDLNKRRDRHSEDTCARPEGQPSGNERYGRKRDVGRRQHEQDSRNDRTKGGLQQDKHAEHQSVLCANV